MTDNQQDKPDLDRRRFIHGAGAGALALGSAGIVSSNAMAGQDASACKTPGCDYDVVVIGGIRRCQRCQGLPRKWLSHPVAGGA